MEAWRNTIDRTDPEQPRSVENQRCLWYLMMMMLNAYCTVSSRWTWHSRYYLHNHHQVPGQQAWLIPPTAHFNPCADTFQCHDNLSCSFSISLSTYLSTCNMLQFSLRIVWPKPSWLSLSDICDKLSLHLSIFQNIYKNNFGLSEEFFKHSTVKSHLWCFKKLFHVCLLIVQDSQPCAVTGSV